MLQAAGLRKPGPKPEAIVRHTEEISDRGDEELLNSKKFTVAIASIAVIVVACGGSVATPSAAPIVATPSTPPVVAAASPAVASAAAPVVDIAAITASGPTFSAMAGLKDLTAAGKGLVGVILPDVTTSARYAAYDAPYLTSAFTAAGYTPAQFKIDNAQGTSSTELTIAQ